MTIQQVREQAYLTAKAVWEVHVAQGICNTTHVQPCEERRLLFDVYMEAMSAMWRRSGNKK
jgi:hypothetical protein